MFITTATSKGNDADHVDRMPSYHNFRSPIIAGTPEDDQIRADPITLLMYWIGAVSIAYPRQSTSWVRVVAPDLGGSPNSWNLRHVN